jgi:hypothetical protein
LHQREERISPQPKRQSNPIKLTTSIDNPAANETFPREGELTEITEPLAEEHDLRELPVSTILGNLATDNDNMNISTKRTRSKSTRINSSMSNAIP